MGECERDTYTETQTHRQDTQTDRQLNTKHGKTGQGVEGLLKISCITATRREGERETSEGIDRDRDRQRNTKVGMKGLLEIPAITTIDRQPDSQRETHTDTKTGTLILRVSL